MKVVDGSAKVPVIYTAHHASHDFGNFSERVALSDEQRLRFSDYGTDVTVPLNGIATLIAEHSRALGDLNRDPDDPERFREQDYDKVTPHDIWKSGQTLTDAEKASCQTNFYTPFHTKIVTLLQQRLSPTLVVAWDNTAHYEIGKDDADNPVIMKPFILSNRGAEESSEPSPEEPVSCDPRFMTLLASVFHKELKLHNLPDEVHLNLVFKGGYICRTYSSRRNAKQLAAKGINVDVQSLQLEYDTALTHDQQTLAFDADRAEALRTAFSSAIEQAYGFYTS